MAHEARTDFAMLLGSIFLLIIGAGAWSLDATPCCKTSCNGMRNRADNRAARSTDEQNKTPLRELAVLFLKLGTIDFGGPAAHIAMMEDEVVCRRRWMKHDEFLDLLGATNLIPGPNSTEMAITSAIEGQAGRDWWLQVPALFFLRP